MGYVIHPIDFYDQNEALLSAYSDIYAVYIPNIFVTPKDLVNYKKKEQALEKQWEFLIMKQKTAVGLLLLKNTYELPVPIFNLRIQLHENDLNDELQECIKLWLLDQSMRYGFDKIIAYESRPFLVRYYTWLGGRTVNWLHFFSLNLSNVDHNLLSQWGKKDLLDRYGLQLVYYEEIPENRLPDHSVLHTELSNDILRKDYSWTVVKTESYTRNRQKLLRLQGKKTRMAYLIGINEKLIGMTKVVFDPLQPYKVYQTITGVTKEYRRLGLTKLLKARMISYILDNYPEVRWIETDCLEGNLPMISINEKLGFRRKSSPVEKEIVMDELFLEKN